MDVNNATDNSVGSDHNFWLTGAKNSEGFTDSLQYSYDTSLIYVPEKKSFLKAKDAFNYYLDEAQRSNATAIYIIGTYYELDTGVSVNTQKGMEYFELAARKKNTDAQYMLGGG